MSYSAPTVLLTICLLVLAGCAHSNSSQMVRIKGSDTMVILMSALAEDFMKRQPGVRVSVTGGGTRSGIAGMINGTCDIVAASRDITNDEIALATDQGVLLKKSVIAKDAIAIIVNLKNPIQSLTLKDLGMIFAGRIKNWRDLGGKDEPIIVYSRESSSGTFRYVQTHLLDNQDFSCQARFLPSNTSILDSVCQETSAIGYVSYAHARNSTKIRCIPLKTGVDNEIIELSQQNLQSGRYPLSRGLLLYTGNDRANVRAFSAFCLSPEGQKIAEEYGCSPLIPNDRDVAAL